MTPIDLYDKAVKAVPAVKYALGVGGIVSIVVIISAFNLNFDIVLIGSLCTFILMVLLVVFANLVSVTKKPNTLWKSILLWPIKVMVWSFLILVIASSVLLFTTAFFCWPLKFGYDCTRLFPMSEKTSQATTDSTTTENKESIFPPTAPNKKKIKIRAVGPWSPSLLTTLRENLKDIVFSSDEGTILEVTYSGSLDKSHKEGRYWYRGGKVLIKVNNQECVELSSKLIPPTNKLGISQDELEDLIKRRIREILETETENELLVLKIKKCINLSL